MWLSDRGVAANGNDPDWKGLVGQGRTMVVYMGVKQAVNIREKLLGSGLPDDFPVALIANGTRQNEQVLRGSLDSLPDLAAQMQHGWVGLLIIGEVVGSPAVFGQPVALKEVA